jgi:hypothetical protein
MLAGSVGVIQVEIKPSSWGDLRVLLVQCTQAQYLRHVGIAVCWIGSRCSDGFSQSAGAAYTVFEAFGVLLSHAPSLH